jgi:hypothetical protein
MLKMGIRALPKDLLMALFRFVHLNSTQRTLSFESWTLALLISPVLLTILSIRRQF